MIENDFELHFYDNTSQNKIRKDRNCYNFFLYLSGNVSVAINQEIYHLASGDMVIIPPDQSLKLYSHDVSYAHQGIVFKFNSDFFLKIVSCSPDFNYLLQASSKNQAYVFHFDSITFHLLHKKLIDLMEELHCNRYGKETKIYICLLDLLFHINRGIHESEHLFSSSPGDLLCYNVAQYITEHISEDLSLDVLARTFYISKYHLSHIFKDNLGISVHQFITKKRLSLCRDSILQKNEITKVCMEYGFKNYACFYRAFRKEYGISPNELKKHQEMISNNLFLQ